jgi:chorismate mutase
MNPKLTPEERAKLLEKRQKLVDAVIAAKAKPLPRGNDREQLQRFKDKDLKELAAKILKIDQKLGRT